jgi:hypothetical protein
MARGNPVRLKLDSVSVSPRGRRGGQRAIDGFLAFMPSLFRLSGLLPERATDFAPPHDPKRSELRPVFIGPGSPSPNCETWFRRATPERNRGTLCQAEQGLDLGGRGTVTAVFDLGDGLPVHHQGPAQFLTRSENRLEQQVTEVTKEFVGCYCPS